MRRIEREPGFVASVEVLLVATILALGAIVGLQAVRTGVVTELADVGAGIASLSQTYSWSGARGHHGSANGALWQDTDDTCDDFDSVQNNVNSRCVAICDGLDGNPFAADTDATPENAAPLAETPF